jgi:flavodoxin
MCCHIHGKRKGGFDSLEGNTRQAAEIIADRLHADILQLETVYKIPKNKMKYVIGGMQAAFGVCAKIKPIGVNPEQYDRIILGTPVWAGKPAPAINTFLKNNVSNKVTALFTLSGGGDNERCVRYLKKKLDNLGMTVALADRNHPYASENHEKLNHFMEELINGK